MHSLKFALVQSASSRHCFATTLVHSVRPTSWKHWPRRLNRNGPLSFCKSDSWVKIFDLKSGSVYAKKYSAPNQAWSGATCLVISLVPSSKETLIRLSYFRPSLISLSGMPLALKDIHRVYQLNWGVFCALIRSDIVTILAYLDLQHAWIFIASLLDHAGISTSAKGYDMPAKGQLK